MKRLLFATWALLGGCGTRTELTEQVGECVLPRYAQDASFQIVACGGACTLSGTSEHGEAIRFECDGLGCQFFLDGEPGCTCNDLDFANTCGNGIPLCVQRSNFNFSRAQFLPCATP